MQSTTQWDSTTQSRREQAIKRLKAKNEFKVHLVAYLTVKAMVVLVWALTSTGFFRPIWPMASWGIGVVMHGDTVYWGNTLHRRADPA